MILSALFYIVFLAFTLVYFVIMCVVFVLTVPFDRKRIVLHWFSRAWAMCYFRAVPTWKLVVEGRENVAQGQAYVVAVNHRSMIDIILMYVLPLRNFKWVSKKEVYKWPLFGWVLWMHGDVTIERGSAASARRMMHDGAAWLGRGVSMVIFPEGSRSKTDRLNRFHDGAFKMAKEAGVPLLPVVTTGTGSVFKGWRINFRNVYRVRIMPPVSAEEVARTDTKELTERVYGMMVAEHEKLAAEETSTIKKAYRQKML